ncbi:hypothetical protein [Microvirga terricola]|uniref:Sorbosone dehydrogenase family protein n=1 Tax=Microvirga terricola TaxID=2719797 RepID=A0ABX0VGQ0_9HYPH|nr:hypothetical protein [Microvirga terricola]NIX78260.1 hypothetical protein [Microvirga terricola]
MMKTIMAAGLAAILGACLPTAPQHLASPADPTIGTRSIVTPRVTAGVVPFEVTGPKDWHEINRQVAPKPTE